MADDKFLQDVDDIEMVHEGEMLVSAEKLEEIRRRVSEGEDEEGLINKAIAEAIANAQ